MLTTKTLHITPEILGLIARVDEFKGAWRALGTLAPELSLRIVDFARDHGRVTMSDAITLTGASRNTLKQHFRALVERGALNQHGSGRGVWYSLR